MVNFQLPSRYVRGLDKMNSRRTVMIETSRCGAADVRIERMEETDYGL